MFDNQPLDILSERFADFALDEMDEAPTLEERTVAAVRIGEQTASARVLGFGSSYADSKHTGHMPGTPPVKGESCSACRWADVAILAVAGPAPAGAVMYLVALMGKSVVSGEEDRIRTVWTEDPMEVLKSMVVGNRKDGLGRFGANTKFPYTNGRAFREAAKVDEGIRRVCEAHDDAIPSDRAPGFAVWE